MIEKALQFGERDHLVGVWCSPEESDYRLRPTFVFLNAGLVHRAGPSRIYVQLARRLVEVGFSSLRFDHGGIGDSGNRRDAQSFEEGGAGEVVEAMDHLGTAYGCSSFVLVGLCSGARMALMVGGRDPRVLGAVSLDGQAFRTWRFWVHRYRLRQRSILSALALRFRQLSKDEPPPAPIAAEVPRISMPSKKEVTRDLRELVSRNAFLYWIFTGSFADRYNYHFQHRHAFRNIDFGELLQLDYMPEADHILTTLRAQWTVLDNVLEWASSRWPADGTQP